MEVCEHYCRAPRISASRGPSGQQLFGALQRSSAQGTLPEASALENPDPDPENTGKLQGDCRETVGRAHHKQS